MAEEKKIYDANGKWVASQTKNMFGTDVIKDRDGKTLNYLGTDLLGNRVIAGTDGKVQAYRTRDMFGRDVMRTPEGKRLGRLESDEAGGVAWVNDQGKKRGYAAPGKDGSPAFFADPPAKQSEDSSWAASASPYSVPGYAELDAMYTGGTGLPYTGRRVLTPEQERLEKIKGRLFFLALLAHILPLVYAAAALFVKSLPLSYPGMLALLTAGLLLAYWLDAASDSSPSLMGNIFLLLLSSLVFLLLTVIRFGGDFSSLGRREIYEALLKGPACFLAAMVAGWGFGRVAGRRLENTILKAKGKRSGKEK